MALDAQIVKAEFSENEVEGGDDVTENQNQPKSHSETQRELDPNTNVDNTNEQAKDTLSADRAPIPIISDMNDEKMEVDESARNELRKSLEAADSKGKLQKNDISSEDESVKAIQIQVPIGELDDRKPASA